MSAGLFLLQRFGQKVIGIVVTQSLLELLLACRIDPLTDYDGLLADLNAVCKARNVSLILNRRSGEGNCLNRIYHLADVIGSRSAAAAHNVYAQLRDLLHDTCEVIRTDVVNCHAVLCSRKTRVRVNNDRKGAALNKALCDREHLCRAEAAVDADSIDLKAF